MKKLYFFLFLMIFSTLVYAQKRAVEGTVLDDEHAPLPGVNVVIQGTNIGTVTDVEGKYSIKVDGAEAILVFSSVGFTREEVIVGNESVIDVIMFPDIASLKELIVVGYGTEQKHDLTGAVSVIKANAISNRQSIQTSDALQGAVAGVTVTRNGSKPGSTSNIKIRGVTTLNQNSPLVIVDGVRNSQGINDVNPEDIESISVLKDAATTAIYGSEAAAGVILITTKRAEEGKTKIEYSFDYGINSITKTPEYVDAVRYMELWETERNPGANNYSEYVRNNYSDLHAENPDEYPNTNWWDAVMTETSTRQRHNIAFSKGTENMKTRASFSYVNETGLYINCENERMTARVNNNIKISEAIEAIFDVNYKRTNSIDPNSGSPVDNARKMPSIYDNVLENGNFALGKDGNNIYAQLRDGGIEEGHYNLINGKIGLVIKPIDGLKISGSFSPSLDYDRTRNFQKAYLLYEKGVDEGKERGQNKLSEVREERVILSKQLLINYDKEFGDHHIELLIGYEDYERRFESLSASRTGFEFNDLGFLDQGNNDLMQNSGSGNKFTKMSQLGRINYSFANRYLLQANFRIDASSKFHKDYRTGYFPSFSAGWVLSEEDFMKRIPTITNLKLRASYGTLGNDRISPQFAYISLISLEGNPFYQDGNVVSQLIAYQKELEDPKIKWETTVTKDVGVDLGLFENKFGLTFDYYIKNTHDILMKYEVPRYIGMSLPTTNVGEIEVKGWDLELSWREKKGDFSYSIAANISDSKSEVLDINGREDLLSENDSKINREGHEFFEYFGYKTDGLFQTQEEVNNSAVLNPNIAPGDIKYVDQLTVDTNGDGIPDQGDGVINQKDMVPLGGSLPRYIYGGSIGVEYKDFDFNLVFQGVGKQTNLMNDLEVVPFRGNWGNVPKLIDGKFWSPNNTTEQNLAAKYPRMSAKAQGNYMVSDFWLVNGAYMRIKAINFGYTVPKELTERIKVDRLRFYVTLRDYFSFNHYPKGWDPEVNAGSYPLTKTTLLGLNLTF